MAKTVPRCLAVFNMKGGVSKSTIVYNLAAGLVRFKKQRVLLVDIDPQGNSSAALGMDIWQLTTQLKDILQRRVGIQQVVVKTDSGYSIEINGIILYQQI